jgi:flagellar basal-body rod protein FlgB
MAGISLLSALTDKLRWTQQRQDLLAQNVANADTPNYRGQELQPLTFGDTLDHLKLDPGTSSTSADDPMAIQLGGVDDAAGEAQQQANFEVTPEGNGVTLEDEMMKVTSNQMDYEAVSTLYTKSLGLLRTAIGQS